MPGMRGWLLLGVAFAAVLVPRPAHAFSWQSVLEFIRTMNNELSAWAVQVKQTALAANQASQADVNAKLQLATAMSTIQESERIWKATVAFHPTLGQPNTIKCLAQQNGKMFVESVGQSQRDASRLMQSYSNSRVGSQVVADRERLAMHRDTYCTVSEARQGMCELSPNGMQGWDVNYAMAFGEKTLGPEGEVAGYAYAAMITDVRAAASIDCPSVECQSAQSRQLALSAVSSMAASSLVGQITDRRVPILTGQ